MSNKINLLGGNALSNFKLTHSDKTIKSSLGRMKKILNLMGIDKLSDINKNKCRLLIETLNEISDKSRCTYAVDMLNLMKINEMKIPKEYQEYIETLYDMKNEMRLDKSKSEHINTNININDIYNYFINELNNGKNSNIKHFRVSMFSILNNTPIRLTEFYKMKFGSNKDNNNNYIDLNKGIITINIHKNTNKNNGRNKPRIIELSDDNIKYLTDQKNELGGGYLFFMSSDKNKPMSSEYISKMFTNSVKKYCKDNDIKYVIGKTGIHNFRKIEETENCKDLIDNGIDYEKIISIMKRSREMGHSLETALRDYARYD